MVFFPRDVVLLSNEKLKKEGVFSTFWLDCALLLKNFFSLILGQKFLVWPIHGCGLYVGKYGKCY